LDLAAFGVGACFDVAVGVGVGPRVAAHVGDFGQQAFEAPASHVNLALPFVVHAAAAVVAHLFGEARCVVVDGDDLAVKVVFDPHQPPCGIAHHADFDAVAVGVAHHLAAGVVVDGVARSVVPLPARRFALARQAGSDEVVFVKGVDGATHTAGFAVDAIRSAHGQHASHGVGDEHEVCPGVVEVPLAVGPGAVDGDVPAHDFDDEVLGAFGVVLVGQAHLPRAVLCQGALAKQAAGDEHAG
jgi:hypothetical protein